MSDLIDRQAAIDALCKACSMEGDYHKCDGYPKTSTWCDELVALRAVPSAQPETCKGCKHLGKWENELEYGYPSPCTRCKRRVEDNYER